MWLLPSLNRIEKLKEFCRAAQLTEISTPGLVIVDIKDYLANENDYIALERYYFPKEWKLHFTDVVSMGDKIRAKWNFYKDCDWVGILNDDHVPVTMGWDQKLIKQLDGRNFLSCNDRWCAPQKAAGATVWSGNLMRAVGWLFPPDLRHLYIDDIWEHLGRQTGCWHVDMSVIVEHHHVLQGAPDDSTNALVYNQERWAEDRKVFEKWLRADAETAISKIRTLASKSHGRVSAEQVG